MAYALLILRDDNSDELDEFLITFYEKMVLYSYSLLSRLEIIGPEKARI